ncbi:MAG: hypothetical protein HY291_03485 [Planctomycetes bacterium]|nr:hypothetical protein [Planctomycetota bacterium]
MDLIEEQLGRILLVAAIAFSAAMAVLGGSTEAKFETEETVKDAGAVQVQLTAEQLLPVEVYYPDKDANAYMGSTRYVWIPPKVVKQYEAVDLEVPPAAVMPAPGVLPNPGPSLEGTVGLPRWGEELAPPSVQPKDAKDVKDPKDAKDTKEASKPAPGK